MHCNWGSKEGWLITFADKRVGGKKNVCNTCHSERFRGGNNHEKNAIQTSCLNRNELSVVCVSRRGVGFHVLGMRAGYQFHRDPADINQ